MDANVKCFLWDSDSARRPLRVSRGRLFSRIGPVRSGSLVGWMDGMRIASATVEPFALTLIFNRHLQSSVFAPQYCFTLITVSPLKVTNSEWGGAP